MDTILATDETAREAGAGVSPQQGDEATTFEEALAGLERHGRVVLAGEHRLGIADRVRRCVGPDTELHLQFGRNAMVVSCRSRRLLV